MKIPIRIRLTVVYCAVFCLGTVLLETGAWIGRNSAIDAVVDSELRARSAGIEGFLNEHLFRKTLASLQSELKTHAALRPEYLEIDDAQGNGIFRAPSMVPFTGASHPNRSVVIRSVAGSPPLRVLTVRRLINN